MNSGKILVIGHIWMPSTMAAYEYSLSSYDLKNIGEFTRENVEDWLAAHTGDFRDIVDFRAFNGSLCCPENSTPTIELDWEDPESEAVFLDCMYPHEDE